MTATVLDSEDTLEVQSGWMECLAHVIEGNHEEGQAWEPEGVEAPEWSVSQGLLNNGVKGGP